jgi:hypothetical protein
LSYKLAAGENRKALRRGPSRQVGTPRHMLA